jgi:hypothetical protein
VARDEAAAPAGLRAACLRLTGIAADLTAAAAALEAALDPHSSARLRPVRTHPEATIAPAAAAHRRPHRTGFPAKLDADPELAAFVAARLDHMTYEAVAQAVAQHFPPDRRVTRSAILRRWSKRRRQNAEPHPG